MARRRRHQDVEYAVEDASGQERIFKTYEAGAAFALMIGMARGEAVLDVLIWSESGAKWFGGDEAVERYRSDPDASVFERLEIKVNNAGMIA